MKALQNKILKLKKEKDCVILAHNYQVPEIQEVADFVGDSYDLAVKATQTDAKIILFCGVDFMAETAAILNPNKKIILPTLTARCPMARQLPPSVIKEYKKQYPNAAVAVYMNTLAETKAEADVVYTSTNAEKICLNLEQDTILIGPDRNLTEYIQKRIGNKKKLIPIPENGFCSTHKRFFQNLDLDSLRRKDTEIIVHPEVDFELQEKADFVGSTNQMFNYPSHSKAKRFLVGTEIGLVYRMKKEYLNKIIEPLNEAAICVNMKRNTLENAYLALKEEANVVTVPKEIAKRAKKAIKKMLVIGK